MGRHVLNVPRHAADKGSLHRTAVVERFLSAFYVLMMGVFACGCLSFTALIPYMSGVRWWFFTVAAAGLVLLNCRDLRMVTRLYTYEEPEKGDGTHGIAPLAAARIRRASAFGSIFNADTASCALMLLGSVLLLNSSILSLLESEHGQTARWQFLAAFVFFTVGYACNTLMLHDECLEVMETRNAVVFQMSMASTLNLIGAVANMPGIGCETNDELRKTLRSWLHGLAGFVAFGGALVNHFHVHAFVTNDEILFAERLYTIAKTKEEEERAALVKLTATQKLWGFVSEQFARVARKRSSMAQSNERDDQPDEYDGADDIYVPLSDSELSGSYSGHSMSDSDYYNEEAEEDAIPASAQEENRHRFDSNAMEDDVQVASEILEDRERYRQEDADADETSAEEEEELMEREWGGSNEGRSRSRRSRRSRASSQMTYRQDSSRD